MAFRKILFMLVGFFLSSMVFASTNYFYVGAMGGLMSGYVKSKEVFPNHGVISEDKNGDINGMGTIFAGYSWNAYKRLSINPELFVGDSWFHAFTYLANTHSYSDSYKFRHFFGVSLAPSVSFADNYSAYAKLGLLRFNQVFKADKFSKSHYMTGWQVGLGVEKNITTHWKWRVEDDYLFSHKNTVHNPVSKDTYDFRLNTVQLGVIYTV